MDYCYRIILLFMFSAFSLVFLAQEDKTFHSLDSTVVLEEVTVNAYQTKSSLSRIPGSVSVLTGDAISAWDANSMATTINSLPGVYMQSGTYATSRIVIRGMGSRTPYNTNRIKFYLNDIPITSSDGVSNPEDINLQMIDRLEVVKGPASALYGSGLGGTINMSTAINRRTHTNAQIHYGAFNTMKADVQQNFKTDRFSFQAHLSAVNSDGYRENNHLKKRTALAAGDVKFKIFDIEYFLYATYLNAGIPSSLGKTDFETNPKEAAHNWKDVEGYKRYHKGVGGVSFVKQFNSNWKNKLILFGKWNDSYERRPFNNLDDASLGGGIRNKLTYHSSKSDVVVGLEWIADEYKWMIDKDDILLNKNREKRNHLNLFSAVYYRPTSKLNISLAAAYNTIQYKLIDEFYEDGDNSGSRSFPSMFSPRIGVNYAPHKKIALYASVGHGFSLPSPEEALLPEGDINPHIKPEEGIQYELGTRLFLFDGKMEVDASLYWIELNNLLVTKRVSEDIFTGINAGKTRHKGAEVTMLNRIFSYNQFPGQLTSNFSYTFSRNRFVDFISDGMVYDGNLLPGIPRYMAQLSFQWAPIPSMSIDAQFQSVGNQYLDDANTASVSSYFFSNIKLSNRFQAFKGSSLTLYLGINNITNAHYASMVIVNAKAFGPAEPRYYYPSLPRHAYMGISWGF